MEPKEFFICPSSSPQRRYEALKAFYVGELSAVEAALKFGFSPSYFKKLCFEFTKSLEEGSNPFFLAKKPGPKARHTSPDTVERIVVLRKRNYAITDIKMVLDTEKRSLSLEAIDNILKSEGFAPLPKRTHAQKLAVTLPKKLKSPRSEAWKPTEEEFITETGAGPLIFLPLIEKLGVVEAIGRSKFPASSELGDIQMVLSFLALKLMVGRRWSHDGSWNMDRALGFFAGLNVLPKSTTISTYSYRVTRKANRELLLQLSRIFDDGEKEGGEFNLDFKAIPHWGEKSVLEKNWSGARSRAMKSILSLIVQDPSTGYLSYTDAEIKHGTQNEAVLDFVDFWKQGRGVAPKMLIFDSKFTTYKNLSTLNRSEEKIKFLTLRRRSKSLIERTAKIPEAQWQKIKVKRAKGKDQLIRVHDGTCKLRHYQGDVREIVLTDHGRQQPSFLITNDFQLNVNVIVQKYARRWLVEQEIAEQILFFHLNHPSSSIVVKVDFDLTLSLLAHNLYRILASHLPGFEHCTAETISRKFLDNGAQIKISDSHTTVCLKKKTHLPILFELPWMKQSTQLSWMKLNIQYQQGTVS